MTEKETYTLKIRKEFSAPIERLYRAFTEKEILEQWWSRNEGLPCSLIELDFVVGGKYRFGMKDVASGNDFIVTGEYIEIIPNKKISFTWSWEHENIDENSLVTFEFHETEKGCDLLLIHSNFISEDRKDHHSQGWSQIIDTLQTLFIPVH